MVNGHEVPKQEALSKLSKQGLSKMAVWNAPAAGTSQFPNKRKVRTRIHLLQVLRTACIWNVETPVNVHIAHCPHYSLCTRK
jgi:hypothetical protein